MPFNKIDDPKKICKDVTDLGKWGNGDIEFKIKSKNDIDYGMDLIKQAYDYIDLKD